MQESLSFIVYLRKSLAILPISSIPSLLHSGAYGAHQYTDENEDNSKILS